MGVFLGDRAMNNSEEHCRKRPGDSVAQQTEERLRERLACAAAAQAHQTVYGPDFHRKRRAVGKTFHRMRTRASSGTLPRAALEGGLRQEAGFFGFNLAREFLTLPWSVHALTQVCGPFRRCSPGNKTVNVSGLYLANYHGDHSRTVSRILERAIRMIQESGQETVYVLSPELSFQGEKKEHQRYVKTFPQEFLQTVPHPAQIMLPDLFWNVFHKEVSGTSYRHTVSSAHHCTRQLKSAPVVQQACQKKPIPVSAPSEAR